LNQNWQDMMPHDDSKCLLEKKTSTSLAPGQCLCFNKSDIHNVKNISNKNLHAVSLHVYGQSLLTTGRLTYCDKTGVKMLNQNHEFKEELVLSY